MLLRPLPTTELQPVLILSCIRHCPRVVSFLWPTAAVMHTPGIGYDVMSVTGLGGGQPQLVRIEVKSCAGPRRR